MARTTSRPSFKKISKAKFFKGLSGTTRKHFEAIDFTPPEPLDLTDQILREMTARLGDEKLAKRVLKLKQEFPAGTVPELVTYDWLQQAGIQFFYQLDLYGGRAAGGLVPDFVILQDTSRAAVWQIQGDYWHTRGEKENSDSAAHLQLLGSIINGAKIRSVIELWESDIYGKRPWVFNMALAGMGLR